MRCNFIALTAAAATVAALMMSCGKGEYKVTVANTLDIDRANETVELNLADLKGIPAASAVVLNAEGEQVPCQTYTNADGQNLLLFQANVAANSEAVYTVAKGEREEFETQAYSRYVPERADDYAYENNVVAGRIYGPALDDPRTYGSDIWVKSTERLILDEWYEKDDYHHNYGEGMDCYKVDNTLGGGAWAPLNGDFEPVLGDNYATWTHITDGPIRTEAVLEYNAVLVDSVEVAATRVLSLDANSHFVKSVVTFHYDTEDHIQVAIAAVKHNVGEVYAEDNWVAFTEPASDSADPETDGNISVALVYAPAADAGEDAGYFASDIIGEAGHA
ncbi:MAG: DUF4861 domain-containing protein, partial [Bacteroidales bacterium]|nr:DUF4861 domain-containing protein [Bacteroidales bacterium]